MADKKDLENFYAILKECADEAWSNSNVTTDSFEEWWDKWFPENFTIIKK